MYKYVCLLIFLCVQGLSRKYPCNKKNRDIYWRRYKIQETLYIGQWHFSPLQSKPLRTSHSFLLSHCWWFLLLCKSFLVSWLVWLSWLGLLLQSKMSLVWVLVRAHAWGADQVLSWKRVRGNQWMFLSPINVSLLPFLPPFPSFEK